MDYYLGEIWVCYPAKFWRKAYSRKLRTVLIKADSNEHANNKLSYYKDQVRKEIRLAQTSKIKLEELLIEAI